MSRLPRCTLRKFPIIDQPVKEDNRLLSYWPHALYLLRHGLDSDPVLIIHSYALTDALMNFQAEEDNENLMLNGYKTEIILIFIIYLLRFFRHNTS